MYIIDLTWRYKSVSAAAAATFVLSERGEILSPKYAPEITIPAVRAGFIPSPVPIPISATPIVPPDVQALPVATETIAHKIQPVGKKNLGEINSNP